MCLICVTFRPYVKEIVSLYMLGFISLERAKEKQLKISLKGRERE